MTDHPHNEVSREELGITGIDTTVKGYQYK